VKTVQAKVADLRPHPENPRRISADRLDQLKRTLEADREMLNARPLIALPDGTVVCGNQRLRAALELGWKTIPTVYADLDPERARLWMLRDNQGYGEWDDTAVATLLAELDETALDLTGFASSDVDRLLRSLRPAVDPDDAPPVPAKPRSKPGEVYELGPHRLMCGDATDADQVTALMGGGTVRLIATDPPYGVDYANVVGSRKNQKKGGWRDIAGDALSDEDLGALVATALEHVPAHTLFLWYSAKRSPVFFQAVEQAGWEIAQQIVWVKNALVFGGSDYQWRHEPCIYARKRGSRCFGTRKETTVWEVSKITGAEHPTQKPVELYTRPIENHTARGQLVYDPFAGSGSCLIAAEQTGRRALLMELDPGYCDVIRDRYEAFVSG
jgi:DNA modification methylase